MSAVWPASAPGATLRGPVERVGAGGARTPGAGSPAEFQQYNELAAALCDSAQQRSLDLEQETQCLDRDAEAIAA